MQKKIRKAVFPVAGLGTRFLPATKASPKEMLTVVDKPLIQYAVEEAIEAGIEQLIFITGRSKRAIEDHFDTAYELEAELEAKQKFEMLKIVQSIKPEHIHCVYVRQPKALGLGHAVLCAEPLIENEHFAVILADDLLVAQQQGKGVLKQMIELYQHYCCSIIGVEQILPEQSTSYGVIQGKMIDDGLLKLNKIVEKPKPEHAPSNLGVVGRYLLSPSIFKYLRTLSTGSGGEIQLTDGIEQLLNAEQVLAYAYEGTRYDCGSKLGYMKASIQLALQHPELKIELKQFLQSIQMEFCES